MANKFGLRGKPASIASSQEEWSSFDARDGAGPAPRALATVGNGRFAETDPFEIVPMSYDWPSEPTLAALPSGRFVLAWAANQDLHVQLFDRHGEKLGGEFVITGPMGGPQPTIVGLASGGFVLAWSDTTQAGDIVIWAQTFGESGDPASDAFVASTSTAGYLQQPSIAALSAGGFVVSWTGVDGPSNSLGIKAQIFDASAARVGEEFLVNGATDNDQSYSMARGLPGGGFVIAWGDHYVAKFQIFDAAGARVGGEHLATRLYDMIVLASGNLVIAWSEGMDENDLKGQIFSPGGTKIGGEFAINTDLAGNQILLHLSALPDGGFVATWRSAPNTGNYIDEGEIKAQLFDALGAKVGSEFMVNVGTEGGQHEPQVASFGSGDLVVAWIEFGSGLSGIKARAFFSVTTGTGNNDSFAGTGDRDFYDGLGGDDQLSGGAADDGLDGGTGNDTLTGGGGNDAMSGGPGNDRYFVDSAGDLATEAAGEGIDIVYASVSYTLGANSHVESLSTITWESTNTINLTGNGLANQLIGNAGANRLDGAGGIDTMTGREGNDAYVVDNAGDKTIEIAGQGNDIVYASVSYALAANADVESMATTSAGATDALNLTGNGLVNVLTGNAGRNQLDGKGGADTMIGREGNDVYLVDNAGDTPIEVAGQGNDTVYTSISYTLAANTDVEGLAAISFEATNALNLTGNGLANNMIGNDGANQLDGKAGADTMTGRGGNDIYLVDNASDRAFEAVGGGTDIVYSAVSFVLTDAQEIEGLSTITWELTTAINLSGNKLNNYLIGNAGMNVLDGRAGNDTLQGREGADSYAFTTVLGAGNVDVILGFSAADDMIVLENNGVFVGLGGGALNPNAFVVGTAALDADDRIVYNQATGQLFFDADGSGAGAAVQFATLQGAPIIAANDFTVI